MLNIARTIYAAWNKGNQKYELPEAEVIPLGESVNEKKKLSKITTKYTELYEHDNVPLPGFTLHKADRKNWGSLDQTWLVIDPRGFMVRITSENLEKILHVTGVTEGLIQQKCVWARENTETKLQLIPVSSTAFAEAMNNTQLMENKVSMKDVQIGDKVLLQNKLTGTYMGVASLYGPLSSYTVSNEYKPQVSIRRQIIEVTPGQYHHQFDLKILKVTEKATTPLTREESIKQMNGYIQRDEAYFTSTSDMTGTNYGSRGVVKLVSAAALPRPNILFTEITKDEAKSLFNVGLLDSDFGMLMLENSAGKCFLVDFPYMYLGTGNNVSIDAFDVVEIASVDKNGTDSIVIKERRRSLWGTYNIKPSTYSLDNFTKFYKITKHVRNESYV